MRFSIESWVWYTFAVGMIAARLISRTLVFGSPKGLQYDDWIMAFFVLSTYTVLIIMSNIVVKSQSNLLPPGFNINNLTSAQVADREYGSKIGIVVEQMQIAVIWACKACLLILYHRLTRMVYPKSNLAIKMIAVYIGLGFIVMEIMYFAVWCRPFAQHWAVPTRSPQCDALINHRITNAVFNISSDLMMLFIALPMFVRSQLPLKRKLVLCSVFSAGLFVILAAAINKYYSFHEPFRGTWIFWYIRESSMAILVANLPFTWTLLRKLFNLGAFDEAHPPPMTYHSSRSGGGRRTARAHTQHSDRSTGGSAEKHHQTSRGSGSGSGSGSGTRREGNTGQLSKSLIESICAPKPKHSKEERTGNSSHHSASVLLEHAAQAYNFTPVAIPTDHDTSSDIDIEHIAAAAFPPLQSHLGGTKPSPMNRKHVRISADGTGGFTLSSPRKARLAPSPDAKRWPLSSSPAIDSHGTSGGASPRAAAGGMAGGRSARDRRIRAKISS